MPKKVAKWLSWGKGVGQQSKINPSPISDSNAGNPATIISLQKDKYNLRIRVASMVRFTAGRTGSGYSLATTGPQQFTCIVGSVACLAKSLAFG